MLHGIWIPSKLHIDLNKSLTNEDVNRYLMSLFNKATFRKKKNVRVF